MAHPPFSVVIPTYNRALILEECLNSLTKQTFKDFEVLVCDDGSKDNTKEIFERFRQVLDIRYLWEENWGGPSRPRNNGIKVAKGDWICFLDSDDSWLPEKLEIVKQYTNDYDVITHGLHHLYNGVTDTKVWVRPIMTPVFDNLLLKKNDIYNSSVCIRKSVLLQVNGFNEDLKVVEDYDLQLRVAKVTDRFFQIPMNLGTYNMDGGIHHNLLLTCNTVIKTINQFKEHPLYEKALMERKLHYFPYLAIFNKKEAFDMFMPIISFRFSFIAGFIFMITPAVITKGVIRFAIRFFYKKYSYLNTYL